MAKTMEQYMSKNRADYGSRIARPKIDEKDHFKLKGQFLKELRDSTFSGSDHEDANGHIEKVLEIVDLFHIPNITQDQVMLRAFPMSLTGAISCWQRNKPSGAIPSKTTAGEKVAIQEMAEYTQKWHNGTSRTRSTETSDGLAAIQAQLNNLGREIKKVNKKVYAAQAGCEQCKGPYYTKDCPLKEKGKTLEEAYYTQFGEPFQGGGYRVASPDSTKGTMQTLHSNQANKKGTTGKRIGSLPSSTEANPRDHEKKGSYGPQLLEANSYEASHIDNSIPQREKDLGNFTLPCYINNVCFDNALADLGASDVKVSLILGRLFLSTAYAKSDVFKRKITLRVGDEKTIFKSVKPASSLIKKVYIDYIKLNDLNVPLELRRDQVDDLMPTIEEGKVIDESMIDIIKTRNNKSFDEYPSFCDFDQKIYIDCAYNLRFSCMIVVENMDGYRDQDIGDIILGEPFYKASCVEARRFKHLSNAECNKIKPLLKVKDNIEKDNIRAKTGQNQEQTGSVGKSKVKPDKVKAQSKPKSIK
uniref:Eukaryotic translation initiation factor 3 subunit G N-terminal domain-containing protein n=1 Tax=Tanacetum cinerariifolium TaxID=118510 RepID=A0A699GW61_TANCI|nr:hypothetical protein [Tanacetum cinerariifolium]